MEHYFSKKPTSAKKEILIHYAMGNYSFKFYSSSSVFSKKRIDKGSELLIKESVIPSGDVLDIGCGYGAIGIILSKIYPKTTITMTDINERALELVKRNLKLNDAKATVIKSNLFQKMDSKFDSILSNPPQHAGKKVCIKIIEDSKNYLNPNGTLQLVARHQKGGKSLSKVMEEVFGNMGTLGRKSGYHLYCSRV